MPYVVVDVYCFALQIGLVAYWPVMARPGRQRFSRQAFVNEMDATAYGLVLAERYKGFVISSIAAEAEQAFVKAV